MIMPRTSQSASSGQPIPFLRKVDEAIRQLRVLWSSRNPLKSADLSRYERDRVEYVKIAKRYGGFDLENASIFEIGCGQRSYRLMWLIANGYNARAIDMDEVALGLSISRVLAIARSNGVERALKTTVRHILFDVFENRKIERVLSAVQGQPFSIPSGAIVRGDAAEHSVWPAEKIDFIYSEDVFEHIPKEGLHGLCEAMATRLSERGIASIRPLIFTGIQGGHNVEYYNLNPGIARRCPPWDHLRSGQFRANTFLNGLRRSEYRDIFQEYFDILEEKATDPGKGREFMTEAIRQELSDWTDEDLFSNHVRFVVRRKR